MVQCFVPDCNHRSGRETCQMFKFRSHLRSPKKRNLWKKLIRRGDKSPQKYSRVCSCHFVDGDKNSAPTLFNRNKRKVLQFTSPEKKRPNHRPGSTVPSRSTFNVTIEQTEDVQCASSCANLVRHEEEISAVEDSSFSSTEQNKEESLDILFESLKAEAADAQKMIDKLRGAIDLLSENLNNKEIREKMLEQKVRDMKMKLKMANCEAIINSAEKSLLPGNTVTVGNKYDRGGITFDEISKDHNLVSHFTGLPSAEVFHCLFMLFEKQELKYHCGWTVDCIPKVEQLYMTLLKLRRNYSQVDLAHRFKVSTGTVSNIILTWISALHFVLVEHLMPQIPSRHKNKASMPKSFDRFPECRIVLDCTEIFTDVPDKMSDQNYMYSDYKRRMTCKGLVGVAPNGTVTYVSQLYPGYTSDKAIVKDCGILNQLKAGDFVMADKGFLIGDILPEGVTLNIPLRQLCK